MRYSINFDLEVEGVINEDNIEEILNIGFYRWKDDIILLQPIKVEQLEVFDKEVVK